MVNSGFFALCRLHRVVVVFQRQNAVYLIVPQESQQFIGYLATAFTLKLVALGHMIFTQVGAHSPTFTGLPCLLRIGNL